MRRKHVDVDYVKVLPEEVGKGLVEAVVAVFNNVDAVGDRIIKGAFTKSLDRWQQSGDPISVIYSHQWDNPDANIGEVIEAIELAPGDARLPDHLKDLGGLYCKMQFDMEEKYASSVFQKVRKRRIKNWSFAYDVIEEQLTKDANDLLEIDLLEVGPTLVGANRETDTVAAKSETKGAVAPHKTDTTDAGWDGAKMWANLPSPLPVELAREACAWIDESNITAGNVTKHDGAKFIHHMVSADGKVGAANLTACPVGIGVLNGGRTGTTIPDADKQGVYRHLAKHMVDGEMEPPQLMSGEGDGEKAILDAAAAIVAIGVKSGRVLSSKNESKIREAVKNLQDVLASLEGGTTDGGKAGEAGAKTPDNGEKTNGEAVRAMTPLDVRLLLEAEGLA